jgi:Ras-related protein Rab-2A
MNSTGGRPGGKQVFDYQFNFVIIGESGVGKSCLVLNFSEQKPRRQHQVTIACEFASRIIPVKGKEIKIHIWDTAGQENFRSITRSYYRSSVAAIVAYDITCKKSFEKIHGWITELRESAHNKISIFLVGNKLDLERQREVTYEQGYALAKQLKVKFTETCAFELTTVEAMFRSLAEDVLAKIENGEIDTKNEHFGVKLGNSKPQRLDARLTENVELANKDEQPKKKCCGGG